VTTQTPTHGGRREGAGRPPETLEGLLKRLPTTDREKFRRDLRRQALRLVIRWARAELREE
jgi:hypothetical protein